MGRVEMFLGSFKTRNGVYLKVSGELYVGDPMLDSLYDTSHAGWVIAEVEDKLLLEVFR